MWTEADRAGVQRLYWSLWECLPHSPDQALSSGNSQGLSMLPALEQMRVSASPKTLNPRCSTCLTLVPPTSAPSPGHCVLHLLCSSSSVLFFQH